MGRELTYLKNNTDILLAFKIILATIIFTLLIYTIAKAIKTSTSICPNKKLVLFLEVFIALKFTCSDYLGELFEIFYYYINPPLILLRIIFFMPCAFFTIIITRFIYLLLDIYFNLGADLELNDTKTMKNLKICAIFYASTNFVARLIVACFGDRPLMINGSCDDTLYFLSYFFTILSTIFLIISSILAYKKINDVFIKSLGNNIIKNIKFVVFVLLFCIFSYWLSMALGFIWYNNQYYL